MNDQKGFAPILAVVILIPLILGIGTYALLKSGKPGKTETMNLRSTSAITPSVVISPTPATTQVVQILQKPDWKTYTNTKYKYTIQYPQSWYICYNAKALQDSDSVCFTPEKPPTEEAGGAPLGITVSTRSKSAGLDSSSYTKHWLSENDPNAKLKETNPSYMPGIDATIVNGLMGAGTPGPAAFIVRNPQDQNVIQVWSEISYGTEQEKLFNENILRQILSTFKFLNNQYPIYSGALFSGTEKAQTCEEAPARGECGKTASIYKTKDSRDKVLNWYQSDNSNLGWKFEPFNADPANSNPVFGYLRKRKGGEPLLETEIYKNEDGSTTIKIYE